MPADAYAGFSKLYEANRKAGPAHGSRRFFDLARLSKAPIAAEAVTVGVQPACRVDLIYQRATDIDM
jgi:hypothetical protein